MNKLEPAQKLQDRVLEEADETLFWLDLLADSKIVLADSLRSVRAECSQLVKIFASSLATAKSNR